ncbi:hypothetical protein HYH03_000191 [Edaphochlamys debaryana]|uniref:FAST kinase leucine-rich domain-containing protein n=1 Tax=Edaphochlamys debaryana TaxID=47281 RepID=A0A835YH52_9CHLO|nr:hypothetical protein HYH03_000191 [Edaphochlamys debaryana]|eukprot:KAG2501689.1 hypothetical protein HYH03_000191 [Edaphochlamys debaryana]
MPRGGPGPAPGPAIRPQELMARIKAARSWQQLESLVDAHGGSMNHMHVSAVATHMAQLHTSSTSDADGPGVGGSGGGGGHALHHDAHSAGRGHHSASSWAGDHASSASAGPSSMARAGHSGHGGGASQRLSFPLTPPGSARRPGGGPHASSSHLHAPPQRPLSPHEVREAFLVRVERAVAVHLPSFRGRQLANTLWAVAKLGRRPPRPFLEAYTAAIRAHLPTFEPQHLANTLYALMLMDYVPPNAWLQDFLGAVQQQMQGLRPSELAQLCYAAGKMRLQPSRALLGHAMTHSAVHMDRYGIRELALLLHGLVHMGASLSHSWLRQYRIRLAAVVIESGAVPPTLLQRLLPHLNARLTAAAEAQLARRAAASEGSSRRRRRPGRSRQGSSQAADDDGGSRADEVAAYVPTVVLALANLRYQPPPALTALLVTAVRGREAACGPVGLTSLLLGLAYMQYTPRGNGFRRIWEALMDRVDDLDSQQCANALWAVSRLGLRAPPRDVCELLARAAGRLSEHSDAELVALLQAVVALGFRPRRDWLELVESYLYDRLPRMQPYELSSVLVCMVSLGHKPPRVWMARWSEAALPKLSHLGLQQLSALAHAATKLGFRPPTRLRRELVRAAGERLAAVAAFGAEAGEVEEAAAAGVEVREPRELPAPRFGARAGSLSPGQKPQQPLLIQGRAAQPLRRQLRSAASSGDVVTPGELQPQTLSRLLWSLAMLDVSPDGAWMAGFMAALRVSMAAHEADARELSQLVWALARLRYDPGPEWMAAFQARGGLSVSEPGERRHEGEQGTRGAAPAAELSSRGLQAGHGVGASREAAVLGAGSDVVGFNLSRVILRGITEWAAEQLRDAPRAALLQPAGR